MLATVSPKKASKFFQAKLNFTTSPIELKGMIDRDENINIIDVRKPEDFSIAHIPGSTNIYREYGTDYSKLSKDNVNIIYCCSEECHFAASAARDFADHGYPVMELEGGFEAWEKHQLPTEI